MRGRTGGSVREVVLAYPWHNAKRAEVLASGLARVSDDLVHGPEAMLATLASAGAALAATPPGSPPRSTTSWMAGS